MWDNVINIKNFVAALFFRKDIPIISSIVLTDLCNLSCLHCAVSNIEKIHYPYEQIVGALKHFFKKGSRIVNFCGGEPFLWRDGDKTLCDVVRVAKSIGFRSIPIVTNGTYPMDIDCDTILVSIEGDRDAHNKIRNDTYDLVLKNINESSNSNFYIFMSINTINLHTIDSIANLVVEHPKINAISFNFHIPYNEKLRPLAMSQSQKEYAVNKIKSLINQGYPIVNTKAALNAYITGKWTPKTRYSQVFQNGEYFQCCRASVTNPNVCKECGYLYCIELDLISRFNIPAIFQSLRTFGKYW